MDLRAVERVSRTSKSSQASYQPHSVKLKTSNSTHSKRSSDERLQEFHDKIHLSHSSSSKHIFLFLVFFLFFGIIALQALSVIAAWREPVMALFGHFLLLLVAGGSALKSMQLCLLSLRHKFTQAEESDWTLLTLSLVAPLVLLVARFNPLPTSDDSKVNCLVTYAFLLRLGSLMDLPPAHSIVQVAVSFPLFV